MGGEAHLSISSPVLKDRENIKNNLCMTSITIS